MVDDCVVCAYWWGVVGRGERCVSAVMDGSMGRGARTYCRWVWWPG